MSEKTVLHLTIPKELAEKVKADAEENLRTVSAQMTVILGRVFDVVESRGPPAIPD